ncbi:MAG: hypothetical protein R2873_27865 [Caldilineaceae bacterium]
MQPSPRRLRSAAWMRLLLLLIVVGGFALRLTALTRQNIWWDEARNIEVALRPFGQIAGAPELDIQPPSTSGCCTLERILGIEMGMDLALVAFGAFLERGRGDRWRRSRLRADAPHRRPPRGDVGADRRRPRRCGWPKARKRACTR